MKCIECGHELKDGAVYCIRCGAMQISMDGTRLEGKQEWPEVEPQSGASNWRPSVDQGAAGGAGARHTKEFNMDNGGGNSRRIAAIVIGLVLAAAIIAIMAFSCMGPATSGSDDSSKAADTTTSTESASSEGVSSASAVSDGVANGSQSASQSVATTSSNSEKAASASASVEGGAESSEQTEPTQPQAGTQPGVDAPFWGVWIGGFKNVDGAEEMVADAQSAGLPAMIFETTDWSNLNSEHYYVVSVGVSTDEATAKRLCEQAKEAGFDDAYVKYSGERR